jgi:hypothetical protein
MSGRLLCKRKQKRFKQPLGIGLHKSIFHPLLRGENWVRTGTNRPQETAIPSPQRARGSCLPPHEHDNKWSWHHGSAVSGPFQPAHLVKKGFSEQQKVGTSASDKGLQNVLCHKQQQTMHSEVFEQNGVGAPKACCRGCITKKGAAFSSHSQPAPKSPPCHGCQLFCVLKWEPTKNA